MMYRSTATWLRNYCLGSKGVVIGSLECPGKPNLSTVCLLVCRVFWFFSRKIWVSSETLFLLFLCPGCTVKSICLSVDIFLLAGFQLCPPPENIGGNELPNVGISHRVFIWREKSTDLKSVDMSTYQQI